MDYADADVHKLRKQILVHVAVQVITLDTDQQDPFVEQHIKPCARLWDALKPYRGPPDHSVPRPVTDRLIFTEAPVQYNTIAAREGLLADALFKNSSKRDHVHAVMEKHRYILTLDYTMKMLHLEVLPTCKCCVALASCALCLLCSMLSWCFNNVQLFLVLLPLGKHNTEGQ